MVRDLRHELAAVPGAHALVGGQSATELDTNNAAAIDRVIVMPLVLVVVMVVLGILLQAVVAPILLALTVVLSFATALAVLPLVTLAEIGFIVAFGVLLDTLVVRSLLVPALVGDVGPRVWWPSGLAREGPTGPPDPGSRRLRVSAPR